MAGSQTPLPPARTSEEYDQMLSDEQFKSILSWDTELASVNKNKVQPEVYKKLRKFWKKNWPYFPAHAKDDFLYACQKAFLTESNGKSPSNHVIWKNTITKCDRDFSWGTWIVLRMLYYDHIVKSKQDDDQKRCLNFKGNEASVRIQERYPDTNVFKVDLPTTWSLRPSNWSTVPSGAGIVPKGAEEGGSKKPTARSHRKRVTSTTRNGNALVPTPTNGFTSSNSVDSNTTTPANDFASGNSVTRTAWTPINGHTSHNSVNSNTTTPTNDFASGNSVTRTAWTPINGHTSHNSANSNTLTPANDFASGNSVTGIAQLHQRNATRGATMAPGVVQGTGSIFGTTTTVFRSARERALDAEIGGNELGGNELDEIFPIPNAAIQHHQEDMSDEAEEGTQDREDTDDSFLGDTPVPSIIQHHREDMNDKADGANQDLQNTADNLLGLVSTHRTYQGSGLASIKRKLETDDDGNTPDEEEITSPSSDSGDRRPRKRTRSDTAPVTGPGTDQNIDNSDVRLFLSNVGSALVPWMTSKFEQLEKRQYEILNSEELKTAALKILREGAPEQVDIAYCERISEKFKSFFQEEINKMINAIPIQELLVRLRGVDDFAEKLQEVLNSQVTGVDEKIAGFQRHIDALKEEIDGMKEHLGEYETTQSECPIFSFRNASTVPPRRWKTSPYFHLHLLQDDGGGWGGNGGDWGSDGVHPDPCSSWDLRRGVDIGARRRPGDLAWDGDLTWDWDMGFIVEA